jgi:hypothetical protein
MAELIIEFSWKKWCIGFSARWRQREWNLFFLAFAQRWTDAKRFQKLCIWKTLPVARRYNTGAGRISRYRCEPSHCGAWAHDERAATATKTKVGNGGGGEEKNERRPRSITPTSRTTAFPVIR